jgi:5-methylcytosine-specific restriction endonuclease McrA
MGGAEHGLSGYSTRRCRCAICRAAWAEYHRDYQRRRKLNSGKPLGQRTHPAPAPVGVAEAAQPAPAPAGVAVSAELSRPPPAWVEEGTTPAPVEVVRPPLRLRVEVWGIRCCLLALAFCVVAAYAIHALVLASVSAVVLCVFVLWRQAVPAPCLLCGSRGSHACSYRIKLKWERTRRHLPPPRRFGRVGWFGRRSAPPRWRGLYFYEKFTAAIIELGGNGSVVWLCDPDHNHRFAAEANRCGKAELGRAQRGFGRRHWGFHRRGQKYDFLPGVRKGLSRRAWGEMIAESAGACFYCGSLTVDLEADHVVPVSRGGSSLQWNFVVSCRSCNRKKSDLTGREFVRMPSAIQRMKFDEIDDLTNSPRLRWRERRRLRREERRRRKRNREGSGAISPRPAPRPDDDVSIPTDIHGTATERYQQRYALLHQRYGMSLPRNELEALQTLFKTEAARERLEGLEGNPGSPE